MLIHSAGLQCWKNVSSQKLLAEVFHDHLARARGVGLLYNGLDVVTLPYIAHHGDDAVRVIFLKPGNNDGGIESSRVSEHNFFRHKHSLRAGDRRPPVEDKESLSVRAAGFPPAQKLLPAEIPHLRRSLQPSVAP